MNAVRGVYVRSAIVALWGTSAVQTIGQRWFSVHCPHGKERELLMIPIESNVGLSSGAVRAEVAITPAPPNSDPNLIPPQTRESIQRRPCELIERLKESLTIERRCGLPGIVVELGGQLTRVRCSLCAKHRRLWRLRGYIIRVPESALTSKSAKQSGLYLDQKNASD